MQKERRKWSGFENAFGEDNWPEKSKEFKYKINVIETDSSNTHKQNLLNFFKKLAPDKEEDLAVHPKKVAELKNWLENSVSKNSQKSANDHQVLILVISGPTGCGKTTTLKLLAKKLNISISEWINPVDHDNEFVRATNQSNRFVEFLTESKWNSLLTTDSRRKVVLVKDFPNIFLNNPEEFINVMEKCYQKSKYPIIFICTETSTNKINLLTTFFTQEVKDKFKISSISFNACAVTILKSAIRRAEILVDMHNDILNVPSSQTVEAIIFSSMGDIRCAINQYYFASLLGTTDLPCENLTEKTGTKRKRTGQTLTLKSMKKDESLGLFHSLGRVLNPKRIEMGKSWRLNCNFNKLIDDFAAQPYIITGFLFENYIKYFGNLQDLHKASNFLSLSQIILNCFDRHDTPMFALWISVLGIMVVNNNRVSKWNQISGLTKMNSSKNNKDKEHPLDQCFVNIIKQKIFSEFVIKK